MAHERDVRRSVYALTHRDLDPEDLFRSTVEVLRRAMPADGWCGITFDPVTLLPTGGVHDEGIATDDLPRLMELEYAIPDVHQFIDLARTRAGIGVMSAADRDQSARFVEVLEPNGFEDEVRSVLRADGLAWGGLVLFRREGSFDTKDVALLRDVSVYVAAALRRWLVRVAADSETTPDGPGVVIFTQGRLDAMTPAAHDWLKEIPDVGRGPDGLPPALVSLAHHTRAAALGGELPPARARARTLSGRWLLMHGATLDEDSERVAVTIEPADPLELAPLLMEAYDLTRRERDVVELLLRGSSTREIADALFVSSYTVQDHLKSIFDKIGVRSRREVITAMLYRHYLPAVDAGQQPSLKGGFAA